MLFDLEDLSRECTLFDEPLEPFAEFCVTDHMYARGEGNQDDQETLEVIAKHPSLHIWLHWENP